MSIHPEKRICSDLGSRVDYHGPSCQGWYEMYTEMVGTHMLVESGGATEDEVAAADGAGDGDGDDGQADADGGDGGGD
jgi:hypothetical protein